MRADAADPTRAVGSAFICVVPLRWMMSGAQSQRSRHAMRVGITTPPQSRFFERRENDLRCDSMPIASSILPGAPAKRLSKLVCLGMWDRDYSQSPPLDHVACLAS